MEACFTELHRAGRASSFEVWRDDTLVGGLYGVGLGRVFCAESMFHLERDASKVALVAACRQLAAQGVELLELQFVTPHLARFGARAIPRREYLALLSPVPGAAPASAPRVPPRGPPDASAPGPNG